MNRLLHYLPMDRRLALAQGVALPDRSSGAALFADLSGFTALTEALARLYGPQRGAEEITLVLNRVYEALCAEVDRYGGSVIAFAGDALVAWFAGDTGLTAGAAGLAMLQVMRLQPPVIVAGQVFPLQLKATVAAGPIQRLLVGDPATQHLEVLAGATMNRLAAAAEVTRPGELVVEAATLVGLAGQVELAAPGAGLSVAPHAVVRGFKTAIPERPWPTPAGAIRSEQARPWLLPPVHQRLEAGQGEFLAELRYTVCLFLHFADQDYDRDADAGPRLNQFVRHVQAVLARRQGFLLHVLLGDKGSALFAAFGAPVAFGDEPRRAAAAALDLLDLPPDLAAMGPVKIGLSDGQAWAGSYGGSVRTYSLLGDTANTAARLMQAAAPSQVLVAARLAARLGPRFSLVAQPTLRVKGKAAPLETWALLGMAPVGPVKLHEPQYTLSLVGRAAQVTQFNQLLAQAQAGRGQVVGLVAEAGMGKSRLLTEFMRGAREAGFAVHIGEGQATGTRAPYLAWQSIWRGLFGLNALDPPVEQVVGLATALREVNPALEPRLPLLGAALDLPVVDNATTAGMDTRLRKESLEALLVDLVRAYARREPLLLALDDAHWLDPLSLDLLHVIGRAVAGLPALVVTSARPADTETATSDPLASLPHYTALRLDALAPDEAAELARRKTAARYGAHVTPAPAFIEAIIQRAEGNPFYIEELVNYVRERGVAPDDATLAGRLDLPGSLTSLILSRIDRLTVEQQTTLKVASIIGRVFKMSWLWGVYPALGSARRVQGSLDELARLDLTPLDTPDPDLSYLFKHVLIQEVAYESLPFSQRAQLHEHLAGWLEGYPGQLASVDLLAYHYGRSRNTGKQREYYQKAGDAAAARYANASAVQYYQRLLALLGPDEQGPTLIALAGAHERLSAWEQADACYQAALTAAERSGDARVAAQARLGRGLILRRRSAYDEAEVWLEQARRDFEAAGDRAGVSAALLELAFTHHWWQRPDRALEILTVSLALEGETGDKARLARIYHALGLVENARLDQTRAVGWLNQSLALKRELDDKPGVATMLTNIAVVLFQETRYAEAQALLAESMVLFQSLGARFEYARASQLLAMVRLMQGQWEVAQATQREALGLLRDLGAQREIAEGLVGLAAAHPPPDDQGDVFRRAVRLTAAAAAIIDHTGAHMPTVMQGLMERIRAEAGAALPLAEVETAWVEGYALDYTQAVAYALSA